MEHKEYKFAKGVYLYQEKYMGEGWFSIDNSASIQMRITDEVEPYIIASEKDMQKLIKEIFPNENVDPQELFFRTTDMLVFRKAPLQGTKYIKDDGTFVYGLRGGSEYHAFMGRIPFLHKQDLSLENPQDLEIIKSYQNLEWPYFSADQNELAELLKAKGYPITHYGRSGFESRNTYCIEYPDVDETDIIEVIKKINQGIQDAKQEIEQRKLQKLEQEFAENHLDEDGIFSYIFIGGLPENPQNYDHEKYGEIETVIENYCQDHRRNITHECRVCLYDKEKLKNNKKKSIELKGYAYCHEFEYISRQYNINFKFKNSNKYIINGETMKNVSHLDLDLNNPEDIAKALTQNDLSWPSINATNTILKEELEQLGYVLEHQGRSGFASRNSYEIRTKDGIITPETVAQIKNDLEQAKLAIRKKKLAAFDAYFDEQSTDKAKVYSLVETGYDYDLTRIIDEDKYERIAQIRVSCTADHRRNYDHTYLELLIHKERIKEDKRKFIVLEVPKEMIGKIIGKGGSNIKALQQKFGKRFNVVQDPKEIEAEKKRAAEERARKHAYELSSLQKSIMGFMGDNFILADDESIAISMVEYILNNKDKLSVQPTQEEMQEMKQKLIAERDDKIARENQRKAEEIAYQKYLEEQKLAEQKRQEAEKKAEMEQAAKAYIQKYADEHNGAVIANEDFAKFMTETYKEDELAQKFTGTLQKEFLLKMEEERAMQQRFAKAEKNFDKVAAEEFKKFFESDFETDGHGYDYFNIVGKARRKSAYSMIAQKVSRRLGIEADLHKTLEERLLDPRLPDNRIGSWLYEEDKFCDRIVEFNESEPTEPAPEPIVAQEPTPEPTIENLAALWGAKKGKLK